MIAEYRYTSTADLMVEGLQRYRTRHHQRFWLPVLNVVGFVGLSALLALCIYAQLYALALAFAFFLLLLLVGPPLGYFFLRRRHRKSPFFNSDIVVHLSSEGCLVQDKNARSEMAWPLFTGSHRFDDGFLVFHGPQQYQWWPDSALTVGTAQDVEALLRSKVSRYTGAEQAVAADRPKTGAG